jgi:hypothetical protein
MTRARLAHAHPRSICGDCPRFGIERTGRRLELRHAPDLS